MPVYNTALYTAPYTGGARGRLRPVHGAWVELAGSATDVPSASSARSSSRVCTPALAHPGAARNNNRRHSATGEAPSDQGQFLVPPYQRPRFPGLRRARKRGVFVMRKL